MSHSELIVALDLPTLEKAHEMVRLLKSVVKTFKVGLRLFTACGPQVVEMVRAEGGRVFLDLKFHDIPNTVGQACESAVNLGVSMLNVHAAGGREMLDAAVKAANKKSKLIGVTVLTSEGGDQLEKVIERARLCQEAGLDGVVCSPNEAAAVRKKCGADFLIVTPGIRPVGYKGDDDQKRVDSPAAAIRSGANYIVVGRPIIESPDPLVVARQIVQEIALTR